MRRGDGVEGVGAVRRASHGAGVGVDAAGADDVYYVLDVDKVFYVGGLGSDARAELIDGDAYANAAPDPSRIAPRRWWTL